MNPQHQSVEPQSKRAFVRDETGDVMSEVPAHGNTERAPSRSAAEWLGLALITIGALIVTIWGKGKAKADLLRRLDIPLNRNETPKDGMPVYDLDTLLEGINPEDVHPETLTGRAVGNEFA